MNKTYCIYCLTLISDGRRYIGITSQLPRKRWSYGYGYERKSYIGAAIRKYGWDAFSHEIIESGLSEEIAKKKEAEYIAKYNTKNRSLGFNLTDGGDGVVGYRFTKEQKKRLSKSHKGIKHSQQSKERLSASLKEFYRTHEHPQVPYEHILNMIKKREHLKPYRLGKPLSEETKLKLRKANLGKKASTETRVKMSNSAKKKSVILIGLNGEDLKIFSSIRDASKFTGCPSGHITECCKGIRSHYKEFKWKYYE